MDFVEAKTKLLEENFVWMGKNIILIPPWHPLYEVNKSLDVVE